MHTALPVRVCQDSPEDFAVLTSLEMARLFSACHFMPTVRELGHIPTMVAGADTTWLPFDEYVSLSLDLTLAMLALGRIVGKSPDWYVAPLSPPLLSSPACADTSPWLGCPVVSSPSVRPTDDSDTVQAVNKCRVAMGQAFRNMAKAKRQATPRVDVTYEIHHAQQWYLAALDHTMSSSR